MSIKKRFRDISIFFSCLLFFTLSFSNLEVVDKVEIENVDIIADARQSIAKISDNQKDKIKQEKQLKTDKDKNGYEYKYAEGYITDSREYTLKNGLKVFLTKNDKTASPYVQSIITVRAGSKEDPKETTGLAHYFEHLMFKGTDEIGTKDWKKEKPYLDKIEELYEKHKKEPNEDKKRAIYDEIDKLSYESSKYAISNEVAKMEESIGAAGLNAFTSYDETQFVVSFPIGNLDKWAYLEKSRFENVSLRGFHTELETVFQEFNMSQDNTDSLAVRVIMEEMFKDHPYGANTPIGKPIDLKNPSIKEIKEFYDKYYIANNMAISLSGDLEFDETIKTIDKYWGSFRSNPVVDTSKKTVTADYVGKKDLTLYTPDDYVYYLAFKFNNEKMTNDGSYYYIVSELLGNGYDGILDKLVLDRKLQVASVNRMVFKDADLLVIKALPPAGANLDYVKKLILSSIEELNKGNFTQKQIDNVKTQLQKYIEASTTNDYSNAASNANLFLNDLTFADDLNDYNSFFKIQKNDITKFIKNKFDNYMGVRKEMGDYRNRVILDKPAITPIVIDDVSNSKFAEAFYKIPSEKKAIDPAKLETLEKVKINDKVELNYIKNKTTKQFVILYEYPFGIIESADLQLAADIFNNYGVKNKNIEELKKELREKNITIYADVNDDKLMFSVSGLDDSKKNIEEAVQILENRMKNTVADLKTYKDYTINKIYRLETLKIDPDFLAASTSTYMIEGDGNFYRNLNDMIESLKSKTMNYYLGLVQKPLDYNHNIAVYTTLSKEEVIDILKRNHSMNNLESKATVGEKKVALESGKVYLKDADSSTVKITIAANLGKMNDELYTFGLLYNAYHNGLNGKTFKEIREKKGLTYDIENAVNDAAVNSYVAITTSTQPDKVDDILESVYELMDSKNPLDKNLFEANKKNLISLYDNAVIRGLALYGFDVSMNKKLKLKNNSVDLIRKSIEDMTFEKFQKLYREKINTKNFSIAIAGTKSKIDLKTLSDYGKLIEVDIVDLFNNNVKIKK